jgi:hypothetical protein
MHAFLLLAIICAAPRLDGWDACEQAEVRARSCEHAEAWLRAGLLPGQTLRVLSCGEAT